MRFTAFNNFPGERDDFWQVVLLPAISVLRSVDMCDRYTAITFEFLFWSATILIEDNDKRRVH